MTHSNISPTINQELKNLNKVLDNLHDSNLQAIRQYDSELTIDLSSESTESKELFYNKYLTSDLALNFKAFYKNSDIDIPIQEIPQNTGTYRWPIISASNAKTKPAVLEIEF